MKRTTKKTQGQLIDKDSKTLLSEAAVSITLIDPQNPDDRPHYEVSLAMDGYKPDLDNKSHLLKLGDNLVGEVFISIDGIPGNQTYFKVHLQDNIWNSLEWFQTL